MSIEELNALLEETGETPCMSSPELFFPPEGDEMGNSRVAYARKLCGMCPIRLECLDYAVSNREMYGIWGGLTRNERQSLIRRYG